MEGSPLAQSPLPSTTGASCVLSVSNVTMDESGRGGGVNNNNNCVTTTVCGGVSETETCTLEDTVRCCCAGRAAHRPKAEEGLVSRFRVALVVAREGP